MLRDLDDRAKHRQVPICLAVVRHRDTVIEAGSEQINLKSITTGPLDVGETELARFDPPQAEIEMKFGGEIGKSIVFGPGSPAAGEDVLDYIQATRIFLLSEVVKPLRPDLFIKQLMGSEASAQHR